MAISFHYWVVCAAAFATEQAPNDELASYIINVCR